MTTLANLNASDRDGFVAAVGFAFEDSPWIAARAWESRPFDSVTALHSRMVGVIGASPRQRQVELIAAHPDLAGRVAREGRLTASSTAEQAAAGLDRLTSDEIARFDRLNSAYRSKFAFPFVICAREHDKASLLQNLERRTANDRDAEIATALAEIAKIARLRLKDSIQES
jgi:2-oxo-4-hydroxy-4-carboxy-5-ureidoimidazoline decarboxylase